MEERGVEGKGRKDSRRERRSGDDGPRRFGEALENRLADLIAAWRSGTGRKGPEGRLLPPEIASVGKALLGLQRGLTGDRRLAGKGYMDDPDLLGAYLLYYWPVSYLQTGLALETLAPELPAGARILDLGSGPGPASAALADWLGARDSDDAGRGAEAGGDLPDSFLLADASRPALDLASLLLGQGGKRTVASRVVNLEGQAALDAVASRGPFDLVMMGHCLNELWAASESAPERRLGLAEGIMDLLAPGGLFLVVEPSLLKTSRDLLSLRDSLSARGHRVLGPCLRQGPCPALAAGPSHTCHSEAAWDPPEPLASLAAAAGLDRRSVKMTFVAFGGGGSPVANGRAAAPAAAPTASGPATDRAPERAPDAETTGLERRLEPESETALVVSEPMLNKAGRLRYLLCNDAGRFAVSARRDDPAARAAGFFGLRRGDRISLAGAEARGGAEALGFQPATRLEILAPAPSIAASARPAVWPTRPSGGRRHG